MGEQAIRREALFFGFNHGEHGPANHLLRSIDRFVELSGFALGPQSDWRAECAAPAGHAPLLVGSPCRHASHRGVRPQPSIRTLNRVPVNRDLVIADVATGNPVLVIELDDKTHRREDRQARDVLVNEVLRAAGIPVIRFKPSQRVDIGPCWRPLWPHPHPARGSPPSKIRPRAVGRPTAPFAALACIVPPQAGRGRG